VKNHKVKKPSKHHSNAAIFGAIYEDNAWGGEKGEFYSGPGSHNPFITAYAKTVYAFILKHDIHEIIEIGCGDFNVTNKVLELLNEERYNFQYLGYDVVKPLIERNISNYASSKINFECKDPCINVIKTGDLLIIRQVLQHLSNRSIKKIVSQFKNYKYIIVSEHQFADKYENMIVPNRDMETSKGIRLEIGSGLYLDKEPFNCKIVDRIFSFQIPASRYRLETAVNTCLIITA